MGKIEGMSKGEEKVGQARDRRASGLPSFLRLMAGRIEQITLAARLDSAFQDHTTRQAVQLPGTAVQPVIVNISLMVGLGVCWTWRRWWSGDREGYDRKLVYGTTAVQHVLNMVGSLV